MVGSDTDPYMLSLNYASGIYSYPGYTIGMINGNVQPNMDLRPTMTTSVEAGTELKFFNNRLGIDFTYYWQNSKDQIMRLASSSTSGYTSRLINAGQIRNTGIELAVNGRAVQAGDFAWDLGLNFAKNNNKLWKTQSHAQTVSFAQILKRTLNHFSAASGDGTSTSAQVGRHTSHLFLRMRRTN